MRAGVVAVALMKGGALRAGVQAIGSGVDLALAAGTTSRGADALSESAYAAVLTAARDKRLSQAAITAAYQRIVAPKRRLLTPQLP